MKEAVGALVGAPVGEDNVDRLKGHPVRHGTVMEFASIYIFERRADGVTEEG